MTVILLVTSKTGNAPQDVLFLNDMVISWASQKQKTVALSSCEAEYVAATFFACQVM